MSQTLRSSRAEVRNPILMLPSMQKLMSLPAGERLEIAGLLDELSKDAGERAQKSWRQNKGPMAAYWKAVSVYAKHIRAALRRGVR